MIDNKCEDDQNQNSYLSSLFYREINPTKIIASKTQSVVSARQKKQNINRNKTQASDLNQECFENIKRKNSLSGSQKFRKLRHHCNDSKCTPYQNIKNREKQKIKVKRDKISVQIEQLPFVLEESMANWLIVKEAVNSNPSFPRFKTEPSAEREIVCISDMTTKQSNHLDSNHESQIVKQKCRNIEVCDKERQKSIKIMLSYYKNKNIIKHNLKVSKAPNITNQGLKQSINLKLSTLSEDKPSLKMGGLKEKFKNMYISKRQLTFKNKKAEESVVATENFRAHRQASTHSDITDKATKSQLEGILNSFKVDMKFQEKKRRPRTADRHPKQGLSSNCKDSKKNASTNAIEMTGWQQEPDHFERDIFFS